MVVCMTQPANKKMLQIYKTKSLNYYPLIEEFNTDVVNFDVYFDGYTHHIYVVSKDGDFFTIDYHYF